MNKDLIKTAKEIYGANKAKGFHEESHSAEHLLCLVVSELMEAVEADRKGCRADMEHYVDILGSPAHKNGISDDDWFHLFQHTIKDSVEDELADAIIRLLDTAGALDLVLYTYSEDSYEYDDLKEEFENGLFTESILIIIRRMLNSPLSLGLVVSCTIFYIEILCEVMNIDLWKHVELKLKYNSLRPYKHGKKY